MLRKSVQGAIALAATIALSSAAGAGGRGGMGFVRPGGGFHGGGGVRMGRQMPAVAGTWHVRTGRTYFTGFGHTNTAYGSGAGGAGAGRWLGGHTNTQLAGAFHPYLYGRDMTLMRYGQNTRTAGLSGPDGRRAEFGRNRFGTGFAGDRDRLAYGYGRVVPSWGGGSYGTGGDGFAGYGGEVSPGYGGVPLASQYAEPPLNQGYGGGADMDGGNGYPSVVGSGGPKVIVINNHCNCSPSRGPSPVVYRFGVGSYY